QPRSLGSRSPAGGGQWPALVEKLRDAHQRGLSHPLLRRAGGPPARRVTSTLRTARCGPACRVVWQGSRGITSGPYADSSPPKTTVFHASHRERGGAVGAPRCAPRTSRLVGAPRCAPRISRLVGASSGGRRRAAGEGGRRRRAPLRGGAPASW